MTVLPETVLPETALPERSQHGVLRKIFAGSALCRRCWLYRAGTLLLVALWLAGCWLGWLA